MTAHLAMARFLGGTNGYGVNGQIAEAMLLTLTGDQALALKQLDTIGTNDAATAVFVRALRARNTGDYRPLSDVNGLTQIESIEWFSALSDWIGAPSAWLKLSDVQQRTIDFVRSTYQENYSVEMGHELLAVSIPLEMQEISTVYELSHHEKLTRDGLVSALNELPERCFTKSGGTIRVRVIGWGQWANFLQRHLCHAIQQDFNLLQNKWGVPDDAREFTAKCDQSFAGMRLYPFVRLMNSTELQSYRQSMADAFKLTVAAPELVPAGCWDWLFHQRSFAPPFPSDYDPHVNDWFTYNPLLGTVYDLGARLHQPTLVDRPDALAFFEKLRQLAPDDCRLANFILEKKYNNHPTYEQAMELYSNMLPYSVTAIQTVADTVKDRPDKYENLMLHAADLSPAYYYELAQYALDHHDEDKAAQYYDKGCDNDPDSVGASYYAEWRVRYYLKKGLTDKAREIANQAGEVYSAVGLEAKAFFFEATSNYDEAFKWYAKGEERYDDSSPLVDFCLRYKELTGDTRFDSELQQRIKKLFPKGVEKVSLSDFHNPPSDGAVFKGQSDLLTAAGLKEGAVVVAVYGIRAHNFKQYSYGRGLKDTPELDLIVWQDGAYREFKPSLPTHRFGVDMGDYTSK